MNNHLRLPHDTPFTSPHPVRPLAVAPRRALALLVGLGLLTVTQSSRAALTDAQTEAVEEGFILDVLRNYTTYADNDKIVTRYLDDQDFQGAAFPVLARWVYEDIRRSGTED